jgi:hypothetical protein
MPRCLIFVAAVIAAIGVMSTTSVGPVSAGEGVGAATNPGQGAIVPTASIESFGSGSHGGSGPSCTWTKYEDGYGDVTVKVGPDQSTYTPGTREGPKGIEILHAKSCPDGTFALIYVPPVNVADVRAAARQSIEKQLPLPALNVSPSQGGLIRMQNWLAVQPVADVTATAAVGPVWITMTATQNSLLWDMGNGDTVTCDGTGSPLPDGTNNMLDDNINGAAECGYTYQHVSAPQFGANDDLAYENTVTTAWAITWIDYTGATGTLANLERSTNWNFQVRQIQTQRVSNDD